MTMLTIIERAEVAMHRLLLSATSVDMDVRIEADDAVKAVIEALKASTPSPNDASEQVGS